MGWVVGIDSYRGKPKFQKVPNYVTICVNNRIGSENNLILVKKVQNEEDAEIYSPKTFLADTEKLNISSTLIRKRVRENNSIHDFYKIIPKVVDYIIIANLWKKHDEIHEKIIEITFDDDFDRLNPELLTNLLKKINFLKDDVKIKHFAESKIGDDKGWSGSLMLVENILYEQENSDSKNTKLGIFTVCGKIKNK